MIKRYEHMNNLICLLAQSCIPFEVRHFRGTLQVGYPCFKDLVCDVVCHDFSYGHDAGLLEIMGLVDVETLDDEVEGWLTSDEVFQRIRDHFYENLADEEEYHADCDAD